MAELAPAERGGHNFRLLNFVDQRAVLYGATAKTILSNEAGGVLAKDGRTLVRARRTSMQFTLSSRFR
jgi:hypothetical protein